MGDNTNTAGRSRNRRRNGTANTTELRDLRRQCARQRAELERLKAIITVASTSDVENVIIVKDTGKEVNE